MAYVIVGTQVCRKISEQFRYVMDIMVFDDTCLS